VRDSLLRSILVLLLALCVPFQAALALSAGEHAALEQCHHDGHDDHGKPSGSHCGTCCASAAIAGVIIPLPASPAHDTANGGVDLPPLGDLPGGVDRPPRALS